MNGRTFLPFFFDKFRDQMIRITFILCFLFNFLDAKSQVIEPGFDAQEALMILNISAHQFDSSKWKNHKELPALPQNFKLAYRSGDIGMDNQWDLFANEDTVVISIRGTVGSTYSWLENLHAAMIPAEGSIRMMDSTLFKYKLADHKQAYVHVGWTYGLGAMANGIVRKINEYYNKGYRNFYLVGFSQGAAIVQLLNSYLYYLPETKIPQAIRFKTFAFASPKPGNSFYSNDYSYINRGGWEFRIINSEDWVPRMPFAVQRIEDMPEVSPFTEIDRVFKSLKPIQRMVLKGIYNKMKRKIDKAAAQLTKTLGDLVGKFIGKKYTNLDKIKFVPSFDYCAAGTNIVISSAEVPDSLSSIKKIFYHHMPLMYYQRMKADFKLED